MTDVAHVIASGLRDSLASAGVNCFTEEIPELSTRDKVVLYVTGGLNGLQATISFDLPHIHITTMIPTDQSERGAWRQTGQYVFSVNDPNSIDYLIDVIRAHCKTIAQARGKISIPSKGKRVAFPHLG